MGFYIGFLEDPLFPAGLSSLHLYYRLSQVEVNGLPRFNLDCQNGSSYRNSLSIPIKRYLEIKKHSRLLVAVLASLRATTLSGRFLRPFLNCLVDNARVNRLVCDDVLSGFQLHTEIRFEIFACGLDTFTNRSFHIHEANKIFQSVNDCDGGFRSGDRVFDVLIGHWVSFS